ncbi:FkbM family methyltransferase [Lutimaribacter sp. EGI FJ00015]|uniref:FkbM family methyltransferase n=1 Tax=Lutimaribacter degradans TaxID=2945989 RepID=A0ACC5ZQW3_9RHOB|nr:FkbM family methyltransferase [Lutimaribacter sp. EGI FJ00013]MCM2560707.1 FkbM family methyltransferase [Lutimaribacter sp. EGI FJ00013]MCO0612348.1 FkbM family methyltransferase [Lutimaribacter sp. EGI FJ00015]MCO0634532.1 FkbM family methyltransferase [Lutimaribacter sp. EGI FJ00014]
MLDDQKKEQRRARWKMQRKIKNARSEGMMQGIVSMLEPGDVVLDCGANVGAVCEPLAQSGATVHAFEPDPYAFGQLSARVGHYDNVTLHNVAVGTGQGIVKLQRAEGFADDPAKNSVKSTILEGGRSTAEGDTVDVELIDFPEFVKATLQEHGKIKFLKMDIEGAELELMEKMFADDMFENITLTVVETHEKKFKELRPRFAKLREDVGAKYPITKINLDWI